METMRYFNIKPSEPQRQNTKRDYGQKNGKIAVTQMKVYLPKWKFQESPFELWLLSLLNQPSQKQMTYCHMPNYRNILLDPLNNQNFEGLWKLHGKLHFKSKMYILVKGTYVAPPWHWSARQLQQTQSSRTSDNIRHTSRDDNSLCWIPPAPRKPFSSQCRFRTLTAARFDPLPRDRRKSWDLCWW